MAGRRLKGGTMLYLVQTTTRDGLRLDGALHTPSVPATLPVDGFCLVHGTGGSFYTSALLDAFTERLLQLGCPVLRVNTRGHDGISTAQTAQGGQRLGAAYEVVDDCRLDLAAWVEFLRQRTGPRIGLLGHSLGAVKCLYALAHDRTLPVAAVAAVSPPRLSYSWFCSSPEGPEFHATYALAEQHVAEQKASALLEVQLPLPCVLAAGGFVEKYGPDERYNFLRFLASVRPPTLLTFGSREVQGNMAFRGLPEAVSELAARQPSLRVAVVEGADHVYSGRRDEVLAVFEEWLHKTIA